MKSFTEITLEEAQSKEYTSLEEDIFDSSIEDARFYTLTPHPDPKRREQGWEKVTYYLSKRKQNLFTQPGETEYLYIFSNPSLPNLLKIGYTSKNPEERKKELDNSTGVPIPFKIERVYECGNGHQFEKIVHRYLDEYRINNRREFFNIDLSTAQEIISTLHSQYYPSNNLTMRQKH